MSRPAQPHSKAPELDAQHAAEKKARTKKSHGFLKLKVFFDGGPSELVVQVSVIHPPLICTAMLCRCDTTTRHLYRALVSEGSGSCACCTCPRPPSFLFVSSARLRKTASTSHLPWIHAMSTRRTCRHTRVLRGTVPSWP